MTKRYLAFQAIPASFFVLLVFIAAGHTASSVQANQKNADAKAPNAQVEDYLPDIVVRESDLLDHDIVTNIQFGHKHLRLSNGTPNIGDGPLYLRGLGAVGGTTQIVNQRIYRSDGTFWERAAGQFLYHPQHDHIHVEDWSTYRLRAVTAGNGVGAVLATSEKTSFCIVDLEVYQPNLPHFDNNGFFFSCGNAVQGLSVGWTDIYTKELDGQNIDITGIPDGIYWLESEVDPDNHFLEKDETNNVTRIQIVIGNPGNYSPDQYEPNNTFDSVSARVVGAPNSPFLGPCNPLKKITGLGIHQAGEVDIFKFYCNSTAGPGDSIAIQFQHSVGDLDMQFCDANGTALLRADGSGNREMLSLNGATKGWYYVRVYGYLNATNPYYELVIDPPANNPPSVHLTSQTSGSANIIHGFETFPVTWTSSDPENDERWVTVWMNRTPAFTDSAIMIPTSVNTPAANGFQIVNTSYADSGVYYVGLSISDGGTTTWDWSLGTVHLWKSNTLGVVKGKIVDSTLAAIPNCEIVSVTPLRIDTTDGSGNYSLTQLFPGTYNVEISAYGFADTTITGIVVSSADTTTVNVTMKYHCPFLAGDINNNGSGPNIGDLTFLVSYLFLGGPIPANMLAANINGDGKITIMDVTFLVSFLFRNGPPPHCAQ